MQNNYDNINFKNIPDAFILKCNHGCKWQYIVLNKKEYLKNSKLIEITKRQINGWLEQEYWVWGGFEMQYKGIKSKILLEPLLRENIEKPSVTINIYCFNGNPKIAVKFFDKNKISIWDEKYNSLDNIFNFSEENIKIDIDDYIKQAFVLSRDLSKDFIFVRADWMVYKKRLYFEELTFTPYSGFHRFKNKNIEIDVGKILNIGGKNEF